ncbi:hypothetical protein BDV27DRAFT_154792 [Aspergillus caelatus]|uniref:Carrier domain-containing protein n=1 Tax=Aspergillus caelatus TaxID=61420 RepID=A0A5N7ACP8_9EURO|nr:uncharacterized protein BDV27DRAFT_154792 [Aspergillus caelatus]KAE8367647.1 hypothetical protein BDV27DRAFT_154792 [Aspergillus caelatus]
MSWKNEGPMTRSLCRTKWEDRFSSEEAARKCGIETHEIEDIRSCTQDQLVYAALLSQGDKGPVAGWTLDISETTNINLLKKAWQDTVRSNAFLRTRIIADDSLRIFVCVILKEEPLLWAEGDGMDDPWVLGSSLARVRLIKVPNTNQRRLVVKIHHAICDPCSLYAVFESVDHVYQRKGDYSLEEGKASMTCTTERSFYDATTFPELPPSVQYPAAIHSIQQSVSLGTLPCRLDELTAHIWLAWAITQSQYQSSDHVLFGTASRHDEERPGFPAYVNPTLLVLDSQAAMGDILRELGVMFDRSAQTATAVRPPRAAEKGMSGAVQTVVSVRRLTQHRPLTFANLVKSEKQNPFQNYALTLDCRLERDSLLTVEAHYDHNVIPQWVTQRVLNHLMHVLPQTLHRNRDTKLASLKSLSPYDEAQLAYWNSQHVPVVDEPAHHIIQRICMNQPNAEAICSWDGKFTYNEVDVLSNSLAARLADLGLGGAESIIPVCMDKSRWAPIAILAVVKSGAAFTLFDPSYPLQRLQIMAEDVKATAILCSRMTLELASRIVPQALPIDDEKGWGAIRTRPGSHLSRPSRQDDALYVAFTSGSTGKPKATVIEHGSYCTGAREHIKEFRLTKKSRVLQFALYAFDVSIMEILSTLMAGGCICILNDVQRTTPQAFEEALSSFRVTHALLTPSFARSLRHAKLPSLDVLILGGEPMSLADAEHWASRNVTLMNAYGPAECSINTTVQPNAIACPSNIGFATGAACWVVDPRNHNQLVPIGGVGELLVQGPIVGRGYLNNPVLTKASFVKFVPSISARLPGAEILDRGYKTGDLVRQQMDGSIVYIGRKDQQVKIRGQRIELAEVEFQVQKSLESDADVVIEAVHIEGKSQLLLVAFLNLKAHEVQANGDLAPFAMPDEQWFGFVETLEGALKQKLPPSMIPDLFFPLACSPTTPTGKIDRRLLRELSSSLPQAQLELYRNRNKDEFKKQPYTQVEQTLQLLFSQILEIEKHSISVTDSFFQLGGDSISAIRLVGAARDAGLEFTVGELLSTPTISEVALYARAMSFPKEKPSAPPPFGLLETSAKLSEIMPLVQNQCNLSNLDNVEDIYPCTALQEGMFALSIKSPGTYTGRILLRLPGSINTQRLLSAWQTTVEANPILRTQIVQTPKGLLQVVMRRVSFECTQHASLEAFEKLHDLQGRGASINPMCQVALVKRNGDQHFALKIHHALCDGWSLKLILGQLDVAYRKKASLTMSYFNTFIRYLNSIDGWEEYWASELRDLQAPIYPALPSPAYIPRPTSLREHTIHNIHMTDSGMRLPLLIKLAWSVLVSNYTDSDDVVIGLTLNGRNAPVPGIEQLTGPTITTVPLRTRIHGDETVRTALKYLQNKLTAMIPYEQAGLQSIGKLNDDCKRACSFQMQLGIQPPADFDTKDYCFDVLEHSIGPSMDYSDFSTYGIVVVCELSRSGTALRVKLRHDPDLVSPDEANCMVHLFEHLLRQLCEYPDTRLSQLELAGPQDIRQFAEWNATAPAPVQGCLHELILNHSRTQPGAYAISGWDGHLTYKELGLLTIQLANYLRTRFDIRPGVNVPICPNRSKWAIVSMLSVLYAGGACVLLDPSHPRARMECVMSDTAADVVICTAETEGKVAGLARDLVIVGPGLLDSLPTSALLSQTLSSVTPMDPAFVIFTSGSTGKPKGIIMSHKSLSTSISYHSPQLGVDQQSRTLHFCSYAFDASIYEIFTTLVCGGCVCVPSASDCTDNLAAFMRHFDVNLAIMAPSVVRLLHPDNVPSLRCLVLGGEALTWEIVNLWADRVRLVNGYGPAEATIMAAGVVQASNWITGLIGPAVGANAWVTKPFDPDRLVARGMIGELLIEGSVLADGYINAPVESADPFIPAPAWLRSMRPNGAGTTRLYRTGDLVQQQRDGSIRFMGRRDNQVKLRGQRIELQEVEHCVTCHSPDAVVVAEVVSFPTNTRRRDELVVFMKGSNGGIEADTITSPSEKTSTLFSSPTKVDHTAMAALKAHMARNLPRYMVPWIILPLDEVPQTASGKTDRARLRVAAGKLDREMLDKYMNAATIVKRQPSTTQEVLVRSIFAQVLSLPESEIGIDDSFFTIGGDSISAMRFLTLSRQEKLHLTMSAFLTYNTVALFCINASTSTEISRFDAAEEMDRPFPLSPIQEMILGPDGSSNRQFNQSFFLKVQYPIDLDEIRNVLHQIVQHHSMLRARWIQSPGKEPQQIISSSALDNSFCIQHHRLRRKEQVDGIARQSHSRLDIRHGPILSLDIISVEDDADYALFIAHHLSVDLVSWRVILSDIEDLLRGKALGKTRPFSFQTWVHLQCDQAKGYDPTSVLPFEVHSASYEYWGLTREQNVFGSAIESVFTLDADTTNVLLGEANTPLNSQPQEIFHAALLHAWQKTFNDRVMPTVFLERHGRDPWDPEIDLSQTVGWFTTMCPCTVSASIGSNLSLMDLICRVKDNSRRIPGKGLPYFSSRFYNPQCKTAFKDHDPAEIIFNYAGRYQQLECPDAVFTQPDWTLDEKMDIAEDMPRFALFDVSINIRSDRLHCSVWFSKHCQRQNQITQWITEYQSSLQTAATELVASRRQLTMCDIPLVTIDDYKQLGILETTLLSQLGLNSVSTIESIYPCPSSHSGLIKGLTGNGDRHHVRAVFKLYGSKAVDPVRVLECWHKLIQRHAILRTVIVDNPLTPGGLLHVVLKEPVIDTAALSLQSRNVVAELCDVHRSFDWATSPAHQMVVGQGFDGEVFCKLETGKALIDGTSLSILVDELRVALNHLLPSKPAPLYEDFASYVQRQPLDMIMNYWERTLDGATSSFIPRSLLQAPAAPDAVPVLHSKKFNLDGFKEVDGFWRKNRLTLTNIFQVAWGLVLSFYSRSPKVCFGTLVSGRDVPVANIGDMVGPCFNVLPCRLDLCPDRNIMETLQQNQQDMQHRIDHQHCSVSEITRGVTQTTSIPLFNTCLSVQVSFSSQIAEPNGDLGDDVQVSIVDIHDPTEYDICLAALIYPSHIEVELRYWSFTFSEQDAMRLLSNLRKVIAHIVAHSARPIASIDWDT